MSDLDIAAGRIISFLNMVEADAKLAGTPLDDTDTLVTFMGSGASDALTVGHLRKLREAAHDIRLSLADRDWNICTDCHERPALLVYLAEGCQAYPDDRYTTLCPQHIHSIEPLDGIEYVYWIDKNWQEHFEGKR